MESAYVTVVVLSRNRATKNSIKTRSMIITFYHLVSSFLVCRRTLWKSSVCNAFLGRIPSDLLAFRRSTWTYASLTRILWIVCRQCWPLESPGSTFLLGLLALCLWVPLVSVRRGKIIKILWRELIYYKNRCSCSFYRRLWECVRPALLYMITFVFKRF